MSYAVIDLETTGFSPARGDRVVEVGVVLLDRDARVVQEWTTLVNPQRDIGATHVHGIRARDVVDAPLFGDIARDVVDLLGGRTLIAHNQAFDVRFLRAELAAQGFELSEEFAALCTMLWSRRTLGASKLGDVCSALGIDNAHAHAAHAALGDAQATAQVFAALRRMTDGDHSWDADVARAVFPLGVPAAHSVHTFSPRAQASVDPVSEKPDDSPLWERITVPVPQGDPAAAIYLELLTEVLEDGLISKAEHWRLAAIAQLAGLGDARLPELHARYLDAAVAEAAADGNVTAHERRELQQIATLLDLPTPELPAGDVPATGVTWGNATGATNWRSASEPSGASQRGSASEPSAAPARATLVERPSDPHAPIEPTGAAFTLTPGCRVVFTGKLSVPREEWAHRIAAAGLITGSMTKNCAVLVAEDPASQSGKAKGARKHGVPIVTEAEFAPVFEAFVAQQT